MLKRCSKCKNEKPTEAFGKAKNRKDGFRPHCKECRKLEPARSDYKKQWYQKNRDLTIERVTLRAKNKKDEIIVYKKEYYKKNEEQEKARAKKHYYSFHEKNKKRNRERCKTPKGKEYYKKTIFKRTWRNLLRRTLIWLEQKKYDRTMVMLGYSANDLKNHIEKLWTEGMNWDNYGEWHIDHIKPLCTFSKNSLPSEVNALNNLQPLWATTRTINGKVFEGNLNKSKKYYEI